MSVEEKVINNYLITVVNKEILELKVKNLNFLFPIKDLVVGFLKVFTLEEIEVDNAYILVNRILDKQALAYLEDLLKKDLTKIKGICFTDLGVINVVLKYAPQLKLIYFQNHNTTNYQTINYYLEYVDSVLISTDITQKELDIILDKAKKPLVLPWFVLENVMYSRRNLLTNYQEYLSLPKTFQEQLLEPISKQGFLAVENAYGTVFYYHKYLDYRHIKHPNILFYYINPLNLNQETILKIIKGEDLKEITSEGFLNQETIYKLKEEQN